MVSFLSCIDDKMANLSATRGDCKHKTPIKMANIAVGREKTVFFVEARPFEAQPEYTGLFSIK